MYLFDHLLAVSILLAAAGLSSAWWSSRSGERSFGIAGLLLLLLGGAGVFWDQIWESPFDKVRTALRVMTEAAEQGQADPICSLIAPSYSDGARGATAVASLIRERIGQAAMADVSLAGLELARIDSRIEAKFVAHVQGRSTGSSTRSHSGHYPVRLKMVFTEEPEGWKVVAVHRYDIIQSAKEIPLDSLH
jgi:hypothetical protein